jgi:hypothetical protein
MKSIAGRLRSMMPSSTTEPEAIIDKRESQDICLLVKRYDKAVSAVLSGYHLCVRWMNSNNCAPLTHDRLSVESVLSHHNVIMEEVSEIRERLKEQRKSAEAGLRDSTWLLMLVLAVILLNDI